MMKPYVQLLAILLILLLVVGCSTKRENISNLEFQRPFELNGTPIMLRGQSFTGIGFQEWENGNLKVELYISKGIPHGEFKGYYENGQLKVRGTFIDGRLNGQYTQYTINDKIEVIGFFIEGEQDGYWRFNDIYESLEFDGEFKNGKVVVEPNKYLKTIWDYARNNKIYESSDAILPNVTYTDYLGNIQYMTLDNNGWTRLSFDKEEMGLLNVQYGFGTTHRMLDDEWGDLTSLRINKFCLLDNCQGYYDFSIKGRWQSRDSGWGGDFILSISENNTIEIRILGTGKQYNMVSYSVNSVASLVDSLLDTEKILTENFGISSPLFSQFDLLNWLWINSQRKSELRVKKVITNGFLENYYDNGRLMKRGTYKDGKFDGFWEFYYSNGRLRNNGTYKDGELDGIYESYYENGQLLSKITYKDGVRDGLLEDYYDNGRLRKKGTYKDGVEDGLWEYYMFGSLDNSMSGLYKNGIRVQGL